jgi:amidase
MQRGRAHTAQEFIAAMGQLKSLTYSAIVATSAFDALLAPTLAQLPRPVGWFVDAGDPALDFERQKQFTPFTAMFNVTGQPAVSLPLYWSSEGLPIGVMLVGRPAGEAALLSLAAQVEAAQPWHERRPPVW